MTLDFQRLAEQLDKLGPDLRSQDEQASHRLARALEAMRIWARRPDDLRRRLAEAQTSWRPAEPLGEPLDAAFDAPPPPADYVTLATDGSHIDVERHNPLPCYLLNVGWARIRYGRSPDAELANRPELAYGDQRLALSDPIDASRQAPVRGNLLAAVRAVREVETLADLAAPPSAEAESADRTVDSELPTLALVDGTFLLWGLAREEITATVKRYLLDEGMIPALDRLQALAQERSVLPAGYVSRPDRAEVVHSLRLAACPMANVDCRACPRCDDGTRPCDDVGVATDRQLFARLLSPGQRSAVFVRQPTPGSIEAQYYGEHRPAAFYLRTPTGGADEIACVELPLWLARDGERVTLLHSLLLDQCRRNMGYPLALMEAHEQAVITGPERESFQLLMESQVAAEGLAANTSAKAMSKRGRWL
jgi:hypothetical protein